MKKKPDPQQQEIQRLTAELLKAHDTILKLEAEKSKLKLVIDGVLPVLRGAVRLIEAWAYGPAFRRAGLFWPNGQCNQVDYLRARRWLKLYDEEND